MQTDYALAAKTIAGFEGFEERAKWDVNAYRLGYGSDTKGAAQTPVRAGDTTTEEEALANLQARVPKYEQTIIGQMGIKIWSSLTVNAKAALLSMAYNYGDLPASVVRSAVDGREAIAAAVAARATDNKGVNAHRRHEEAALIMRPDAPTMHDAVVAAIKAAIPPAMDIKPINIDLHTVEGVQQALNATMIPGHPRIAMDGNLGPITKVNLTDFQGARGLIVTGEADQATVEYLYKTLSGQQV